MNMWVTIVAIVVAVALLAMGAEMLRRRRQRAWRRFAEEFGLEFRPPPEGPRVEGSLDGRRVEVSTSSESSDSAGGVEVTEIKLAVRGVPPGMHAEAAPGIVGELKSRAEDDWKTGDPDFDEHAVLTTEAGRADRERIRRYWDESRRHAFLKLSEQPDLDRLRLADRLLILQLREVLSDADRISRLLRAALQTAVRLDHPEHPSHEAADGDAG